jgi:hypothetical protein
VRASFLPGVFKKNNIKMMHSGVNNGIAGNWYFRSGLVGLSTFLHNLFYRAIHLNRPFFI